MTIVLSCQMPDISDIKKATIGCFLAGSLVGAYKQLPKKYQRALPLLVRLTDKARTRYLQTREVALAEEQEHKMTFEQIMKRNEGQYMYTTEIIGYLEDCINALARAYKIIKLMGLSDDFLDGEKLSGIRNRIEHMDEDIQEEKAGSVCLDMSSDTLNICIVNKQISIEDIAEGICDLHKGVMKILKTPSILKEQSDK